MVSLTEGVKKGMSRSEFRAYIKALKHEMIRKVYAEQGEQCPPLSPELSPCAPEPPGPAVSKPAMSTEEFRAHCQRKKDGFAEEMNAFIHSPEPLDLSTPAPPVSSRKLNKKVKLSPLTEESTAEPRIKDVRKRRAAPAGGAGAAPMNPFSAAPTPTPASNPFSPAPSAQPSGFSFGQSQSFPGAVSQPSQPTLGGSGPFSFGSSKPTGFNFAAGPSTLDSSSAPKNPFSVPNPYADKPLSTPSTRANFTAPASGIWSTSHDPATSGLAGNSVFGQPAADSMQTSPDGKHDSTALGGAGSSSRFKPPPSGVNLFGTMTMPSSTGDTTKEKTAPTSDFKASTSLFTPKPASTTDASSKQQPFNSLFGASPAPKPAEKVDSSNPFMPKPLENTAGTTSTEQSSKPLFGASPAPKPAEKVDSSNPFMPKPAEKTGTTPAQPFKSLFGASPASKPAENASPSNPFMPKPVEKTAGTTSTEQSSKSLFGASPASTPAEKVDSENLFMPKPAETADIAPKPQPFKSLFGPSPAPKPAEKVDFSNPFMPKPAETAAATSEQQPFKSLFGASPAPKPANEQPKASHEVVPKPAPQKVAPEPAKEATAPPSQKVSSTAPAVPFQIPKSDIPAGGSKKDREATELIYKVQALNESFKRQINKLDTSKDDFDKLIQFYLKCRDSIGAPVAIKADSQAKKTPTTHISVQAQLGETAQAQQGTTQASSDSTTANVFAKSFSAPAPTPAPPSDPAPPSASVTQPHTATPPITATPSEPVTSVPAAESESVPASKPTPPSDNAPPSGTPNEDAPASVATSTGDTVAKEPSEKNAVPAAQPSAEAPAPPVSIPRFGNGTSGTDFMVQFKKMSEKTAAEEKAKRKAEEFDSDEDNEEEWERQDAERQREKRAKIEEAGKKRTEYVPGEGFKFVDKTAASIFQPATQSPATSAPPAVSSFTFGGLSQPTPGVENIFGRPPTAPQQTQASVNSQAPSSSIFATPSGPVPNSQNIFGGLSSTPQQATTPQQKPESMDWHLGARGPNFKRRTPDKNNGDDDSEEGEGDHDFEAALRKSKWSKPSPTMSKSSLNAPLPAPTAAAGRSLFDRVQSSPAPTGPTENTSVLASDVVFSDPPPMATPTVTAPVTPSVSICEGEDGEPGEVFDLARSNVGEEEEQVVFECRARAFKLNSRWEVQGTGIVRLLLHPGSRRARLVLRVDPSGGVILNTLLKKELNYHRSDNSVQFMVPRAGDRAEHWAIRVKPECLDGFYGSIQKIKN
ncbi:hypothetical protein NUU61_008309 [Penicillium alfredii]|uniref:RanBD1 domain-containing protein n=1 Tax=Penicillium alfredii TaxID=1506179 RepID=A0A9W9JZX4_9EURO|nr:uncharacterized protein NUU61_008309 [Penicillium alfredii]KAJ5087002.1 hypothetical protein NUU61_008309 [Penicillium alfredii]